MTGRIPYCSFCGRHKDDVPTHDLYGAPADPMTAICLYCARAAVRHFGEQPDAGDSVRPFEPPTKPAA